MKDLSQKIAEATAAGGKQYSFHENHDPTVPTDFWFQEAHEGLVLFVVFYTQACRWSRCLGCNLPSLSSQHHVEYRSLMAQIDRVFSDPRVTDRQQDIRKVIVSNNGSVLDQDTFSSTALVYLLANINLHLPNVTVISLETRPEYVEVEELEFMARVLAEGDTPTVLELAVGVEAYDDHIRNDIFKKGLNLDGFEDFAALMGRHHFRIKCYFMQKPVPEMSDDQAVQDIRLGIDYLSEVAQRRDVPINMHLNPTFVARGTPLEDAFVNGAYEPPALRDVARAAYYSLDKPLSLFVGLNDEGLAVPGGSFLRPGDEAVQKALDLFNRTQDHACLARVLG